MDKARSVLRACAGYDHGYLCVADYHYSYAEGNLVHAISDFAVKRRNPTEVVWTKERKIYCENF